MLTAVGQWLQTWLKVTFERSKSYDSLCDSMLPCAAALPVIWFVVLADCKTLCSHTNGDVSAYGINLDSSILRTKLQVSQESCMQSCSHAEICLCACVHTGMSSSLSDSTVPSCVA